MTIAANFRSNLLAGIWHSNKSQITLLYGLNAVQEICYLLIPGAIGMLINTFLEGKGFGLLAFSAAYLGWHLTGMYRRILDTQVYSAIYNQLCIRIIEHHKAEGIEISVINARIELLKSVTDFFENDLPFLITSLLTMFGSAVLLYFYNPELMWVCLLILVPSLIINHFFGKKMMGVAQGINNQYERQIGAISQDNPGEVKRYFEEIRVLNIRKSTLSAYNFGLLELFVFAMIATSMYIICRTPQIGYGEIVATYGYILRFAYSFDFIPHITERVAVLKDIQERLEQV